MQKSKRTAHNKKNLAGLKYGRLLVLKEAGRDAGQKVKWLCICDCGKKHIVVGGQLSSGLTKSCGCAKAEATRLRSTTHGLHGTKAYQVWYDMIGRCRNPRCRAFKDYGARGIDVCERWLDIHNFVSDMGQPEDGMTIDRIDNNAGYFPGNCRWVSRKENCGNTRRSRFIFHKGKRKTIAQWAATLEINESTLYYRLVKLKWSVTKAFCPDLQYCTKKRPYKKWGPTA